MGKVNYGASVSQSSAHNRISMGSSQLSQHFHTNHLQTPAIRKPSTIVSTRHSPLLVVIHQLAKYSSFRKVCEGTQVDAGLCVTFASQRSAIVGSERDHVPRPGEI